MLKYIQDAFWVQRACMIEGVYLLWRVIEWVITLVSTIACDGGNIIGSRKASGEEVSNQVSLHLSYNDEFLCGGAIVSPTEVVTVADHLYYSWGGVLPNIMIRIKAGRSSLKEDKYREFEVKDVTFHPKFDKNTMENNIAVLQTLEELPYSDYGEWMTMEKVLPDSSCSVTGWDQESLDLRITEVHIIECGAVHSSSSGNICVESNEVADTLCNMSEGSSLTCDNRLVALLSIQPECSFPDQPAVFESVSFARGLLGANETNGTNSASTYDVSNSSTIWKLITAIFSFIISFIFR